jgi:hypothetical protein
MKKFWGLDVGGGSETHVGPHVCAYTHYRNFCVHVCP